MDRVRTVTDAMERKLASYDYNKEGLLEQEENGRGQKKDYTYDGAGRLTKTKDEAGTIQYTYDANGNLETVKDKNGTIRRTYDELDRVKTYTDYKGNTITYGYDEMGNRISLTYPGGEIVRYAYDKCGNLTDVTDPSGRKTHYEYDYNGRLITTTRPDGSTEGYEYDLAGRVTKAEDKKGGATIHCYQYDYDLQGNIIKITESGNTGGTGTAGTANAGTGTAGNGSAGTANTGAGMTAGDIGALASASMTYTQDNRLDTYNGQKVTYDEDGNMTYGPLNGVMTSFTYDCRNRLIKAGDTTYEYDAENTRIAVQTKDRREEYTVDKEAAYSQVLSITTYEKNLLGQYTKETGSTIYTYGNGLISQEGIQKADTGNGMPGKGYYLYHYNQVGSTTQVTDETGNIVYRYAYSPYGERMGTFDGNGDRISDDTPIRFLYNGRFGVETDQNGLYYMRARYYNTDIKRFLNRDILSGSIENSQSLNQYSYVQGNPVSLADPFGLCPEGGGTENVRNLLGHTVLDILGFVPIIGFAFDITNGIWYAKEKQGLMAAACFIAAIMEGCPP